MNKKELVKKIEILESKVKILEDRVDKMEKRPFITGTYFFPRYPENTAKYPLDYTPKNHIYL